MLPNWPRIAPHATLPTPPTARRTLSILAAGCVVTLSGCDGNAAAREGQDPAATEGSADWPSGTVEERIEKLADHIGGFSRAMLEVGYRYNELYFAGDEGNWPLAEYHAEKIRDAIEQGIERRPGRGRSAQPFLTRDLPALLQSIEAGDRAAFLQQFDGLTHACNLCHQREDVEFIAIRRPEQRLYPWRTP